jgi:predicted NACHT family NTPase
MADWLVEEIYIRYGLAHDLTRTGMTQDEFLYLLDGLNEILAEQERAACIDTVNQFKSDSTPN